jgi:lipopolysaccharide/colanic/teichoic acid biosynthesis glycosyltransferase
MSLQTESEVVASAAGVTAEGKLAPAPVEAPVHGGRPLWLSLQLGAKRTLDLTISLLGLIVLSPLLLATAIAIKLDSRGPVFYRQLRVGREGRGFYMLKFRTMVRGANDYREQLNHLNENDGILFKITRDPRVTRVGRVLRPVSIDELPQLFQVLSGKMSMVGPRPMPPEMDALIDDACRIRAQARPGVTGPWQIDRTPRRRSIHEMAKMDAEYVRSWSLLGDLKVLLASIPYVVLGRGI